MVVMASVFTTTAQSNKEVDLIIELYPTTVASPQQLANYISRDFSTQEAKVRAIYSWLIKNVAYDPSQYKMFNYSFKKYRDGNKKEEITRNKIIKHTLQTGKAVCEGYAMTFEKLCELQDISAYLVRGDTKTNFDDIGRSFALNHMWNIAVIDQKPYLFDATWGAGKYTTKFIKEPSYYYYKIAPHYLINTHYPAQFEDALLTETITSKTFFEQPLLIKKGFTIDQILSKQTNGILHLNSYDGVIAFKIESAMPNISYTYGEKLIPVNELVYDTSENTTTFTIPVVLGAQTLLIYFNEQPAIGYLVK